MVTHVHIIILHVYIKVLLQHQVSLDSVFCVLVFVFMCMCAPRIQQYGNMDTRKGTDAGPDGS